MKYGLKEDLAIALTHYIFRNTKIEDFHAEGKKMDYQFYLDSISYFGQMVNHVNRNKKLVSLLLKEDWQNIMIQKIKGKELKSNIQRILCRDLCFYLITLPDWDRPQVLEEKPCMGITEYIFKGKYKEHCVKGSVLGDKTMCELNHDICNRIYTLIENGWLNIE